MCFTLQLHDFGFPRLEFNFCHDTNGNRSGNYKSFGKGCRLNGNEFVEAFSKTLDPT